MRYSPTIFSAARRASRPAAFRRDRRAARRRRLRQVVLQLEPSAGADLRPVQRPRQPSRPGGGLERQFPASLSSGLRRPGTPRPSPTPTSAGRSRSSATLSSSSPACLDRQCRSEGRAFLRLIDSTPIPLAKICRWAKSNGRIRGMKVHVVYDPHHDLPRVLDITDANVNDAQIGRTVAIIPDATYVFDKGYVHYRWWTAIHQADPSSSPVPRHNMGLRVAGDLGRSSKPEATVSS